MNYLNIAAADSGTTTVLDTFVAIVEKIIDAMGDIAEFFTTNTLGLIILGILIFGIVWSALLQLINRGR